MILHWKEKYCEGLGQLKTMGVKVISEMIITYKE